MRIVACLVCGLVGSAAAAATFFACAAKTSAGAGADGGDDGAAVEGGGDGAAPVDDANADANPCFPGEALCAAGCTNLSTDSTHCGTCAKICKAPVACTNGVCGDAIADVALGSGHACVAMGNGDVWCWGDNARGQLGVPRATAASAVPVKAAIDSVVRIAAGLDSTCAVKSDHTVWCWGFNSAGNLGHASGGGTPADDTDCMGDCNATPQEVAGLAPADQIFLKSGAACARTLSGDGGAGGGVSCWGAASCGDLGQPDAGNATNTAPAPVFGVSDVTQLQTGAGREDTECAVRSDGSLVCWGDNGQGQAGHTPEAEPPTCFITGGISTPQQVPVVSNVTSVSVSFNDFVCATVKGGQVYCWGYNAEGTVLPTTSDTAPHATPTLISLPAGANAIKVVTGDDSACALLDDGSVYCWGIDDHGNFGTGTASDGGVRAPTQAAASVNAANLFSGGNFAGALQKDGSLAVWGLNATGQLAHAAGTGGDAVCPDNSPCDPSPTMVNGLP